MPSIVCICVFSSLQKGVDEFLPFYPTLTLKQLHLSHTFILLPLSSFQTESETHTMLNGFGTVVNAFGLRAKAYLPQISGTVKVIIKIEMLLTSVP